MSQILGLALTSVGAWLLWSPWALVIGGLVLLVAPEVGVLIRAQQKTLAQQRALAQQQGRAPR